MNNFADTLQTVREQHPDLFDEDALTDPEEDDQSVEVSEIEIPRLEDLKQREESERPENLPREDQDAEWWNSDIDESNFERDSARRRDEMDGFEDRPTTTGLEVIAIYLPFHLYPAHHWGVRFFERPLLRFADHLHRECRKHGLHYAWGRILKIAAYAVARHEFVHYLVELEALDTELKDRRAVYRPYLDRVYKRVYPGPDCLEETVANVWLLDNSVVRSPVGLQQVFRKAIKSTPSLAYSRAASLDADSVRPEEDALAAQVRSCIRTPVDPPPVWGTLPRPYVQPWTRYENVTFTMDRSLGGILGRILNAGPLRKTIPIYHR